MDASEGGGGADEGPAPLVSTAPPGAWRVADRTLSLRGPLVMGVLNLTPDSFSDGGRIRDLPHAVAEADAMVEAGAALLDVGGESTRPGATEVSVDEELRRVLPFLEAVAGRWPVPISVDTRKSAVARAALEAGATVVNDVSGLAHDPQLAAVVASAGAGLVLMHMRGDPATMRERTDYHHVAPEVVRELASSVARAREAGVPDQAIVLDPGIGFAKTAGQSLELLSRLSAIVDPGFPVLVGPSRKSFLGAVLGVPPQDRGAGTLAACVVAYLQGARIFRVHDVKPAVQALAVARAIQDAGRNPEERES